MTALERRQGRCTSVKTNYTCTRVYIFDTTVSQRSLFLFTKQRLIRMEAIVRVGGCCHSFDHAMRGLLVSRIMCFNNSFLKERYVQCYMVSQNDKINIREGKERKLNLHRNFTIQINHQTLQLQMQIIPEAKQSMNYFFYSYYSNYF